MMRTPLIILCLIVLAAASAFAAEKVDVKNGNILYNRGDYAGAAKLYEKASMEKSSGAIASLNYGAALYKSGNYNKAIDGFNRSISKTEAPVIPVADYNIGNATYRIGQTKDKADKEKKDIKATAEVYGTALQYYKRAIDLNPRDKDAKFNYEVVSRKIQELSPLFQIKQEEEKKKKEQEKKDQQKNDQNQKQDQEKNQDNSKQKDQDQNKDNSDQQQNKQQNEQQNKQQSQQQNQQDKNQDQSKDNNSQQQDQQQHQQRQKDDSGGNDPDKKDQQEKNKDDADSGGAGGQEENKKPDSGSGQDKKPEDGGEKKEESAGKDGEKKEEKKPEPGEGDKGGQGKEEPGSAGEADGDKAGTPEQDAGEAGSADTAQEEVQPAPDEEKGAGEAKKPEEKQSGLAAYQSAQTQAAPGEMTEQEAKMLLEGYKGEEATGRVIKMRRKAINVSEPAKDW